MTTPFRDDLLALEAPLHLHAYVLERGEGVVMEGVGLLGVGLAAPDDIDDIDDIDDDDDDDPRVNPRMRSDRNFEADPAVATRSLPEAQGEERQKNLDPRSSILVKKT